MADIKSSVGHKGKNKGSDVVTVKYLLNGHMRALAPIKPLTVNGKADEQLTEAIEAFQSKYVSLSTPDGRVDPRGKTLKALNKLGGGVHLLYYPEGPQAPLADIARTYIGAKESKGNKMGDDAKMKEIFEADYAKMTKDTTDGYAWCSSFVSLCTQKLIASSGFYPNVRPPREASVTRFRTLWAPTQKCAIFTPKSDAYSPHKGDIVVFTFSHIGIVDQVNGNSVRTIEGNTDVKGSREGTRVMEKKRAFSQIRCFIRLPVPIKYDVANRVCVA